MKQTNIQIAAPGFLGVNIEDAPTSLDEGWAAIADNCIIDRSGRIGSRKGYQQKTADASALGTEPITAIHESTYTDGTRRIWATGNLKIFEVDISTFALTDRTPGGYTVTSNDWQIATLNDDTFFFQAGHDPLAFDNSVNTLALMSAHTNYTVGPAPQGDIVVSAFGRLWVAGDTANPSTVYWSDLFIGPEFGAGSAGSINVAQVWPNGNDTVTALATHNNNLIIFGKNSFIVYTSRAADGLLADPSNDLFLAESNPNLGCIGKFATVSTGKDLLFVDDSGLRSFARVIQEKSLPIGDVSKNVRTQFKNETKLNGATSLLRLVYSPEESFVLSTLPSLPHTYCFDVRGMLQDGSYRTTMWTGLDWECHHRLDDGTLLIGNTNGINEYTGYTDNAPNPNTGGVPYRMRYYTHPQTFGAPSNLKVPKEADFVIAGGSGQSATCYWAFDYINQFRSQVFDLLAITPDFYNIDEYNITTADDPDDPTEYDSGSGIAGYSIPLSGSGTSVILGLEVSIAGSKISIQEINLQTKIGRMV